MNVNTAMADCLSRVFPSQPTSDHYFGSASTEDARTRLQNCLLRGDGPAVVIGAPGIGKTMLLEVLASSLANQLWVVKINGGQTCTRRALLQAILYGLDLPYENREEGLLRLTLHRALNDNVALPAGVALLVDEAQSLKPKLLEEIRLLGNLARDGAPVVRTALFGGSGLEDVFASTELESFNQQIATRCYLNPLTYEESHDYVRAHLGLAGVEPGEVISADGLDAIFRATDGIPRLISQLGERAVAAAVTHGKTMIDAQAVQAAWSDLHQLPAPWNTPAEDEVSTLQAANPVSESPVETCEQLPLAEPSVIEFGELDNAFEPATTEAISESEPPIPPTTSAVQGDWNADQALAELPADTEVSLETSEPANNPFGESFEDEELVIDRFASLEQTLPPSAPLVTNTIDPGFSQFASEYTQPEEQPESLLELPLPQVELPDAQPLSLTQTTIDESSLTEFAETDEQDALESSLEEVESYSTIAFGADEPESIGDVLIVEADTDDGAVLNRPSVRRREYRQLFAQLQNG